MISVVANFAPATHYKRQKQKKNGQLAIF